MHAPLHPGPNHLPSWVDGKSAAWKLRAWPLAAQTAAQAAHYPFFGIWGPYRAEMDPWQLNNPQPPGPRTYLWYFYNQTAHYLANQVLLPHCRIASAHSCFICGLLTL